MTEVLIVGNEVLPRTWESILNSTSFMPVIVKSIESYYDAGWSLEPSRHAFFEMVYVKRGQAVFEVEGKPVDTGPNDILIIKPLQTHKLIVGNKSGCRFIVLSFSFENRTDSRYSRISMDDFLDFVKGSSSGSYLTLKVNQKNEIIKLLDNILEEKERGEFGSELLRHLMVMQLFVHISRALKAKWESNISGRAPRLKELVEASAEYMKDNYERNISLSDIAGYVFLSTSYFVRVFKDHKGIAPISYLLRIRVNRAKEMLVETDSKVSDIALSTGFSSQQRFNTVFKKLTGLTPLEYRKKNR